MHKWFIPHRDTHKKAHLISWQAILIYILLFGILQLSFKYVNVTHPGVLGIASNVDQKKLIELTNVERQKLGLSAVRENSELDAAAAAKAQNMFAENYWAHYSPSGKDPWGFIQGAGYKFSVAGENLAKNFQTSDEVVQAWMNSPSHRDNMVNAKYQDIGIAVMNGTLNGEETTLVVQEFGSPAPGFVAAVAAVPQGAPAATAQPATQTPEAGTSAQVQPTVHPTQSPTLAPTPSAAPTLAPIVQTSPANVASATKNAEITPLFDPFQVSKTVGLSVISLIIILLVVDFYVLRRRGVFRISSHHWAHLSVLGAAGGALLASHPGQISLQAASVTLNFLK